ncbi:MAG: amidophosphoribosyltransferase [Planctomycetota bacterium]
MPEIKEHCGLFATFGPPDATVRTYFGLWALQHRGQESAGIVASDGKVLRRHVGMGLVAEVFGEDSLARLKGNAAIGHVRYSTTGSSNIANAQPFMVEYRAGQIAAAHNGNIVNAAALHDECEATGSIFQTTMDTEVLIHLIARGSKGHWLGACLNRLRGAYSLLLIRPHEVIAVRDPQGVRPLWLGELRDGKGYVVASETCAFDLPAVDARPLREIACGEMVSLTDSGVRSEIFAPRDAIFPKHCVFEHVYFARPDSNLFGDNVHLVRERLGEALAREHPRDADIVVAVPDSGNSASMGYANASSIPLERGFIRNHYVGRTFIQPSQQARFRNVQVKLNVVRDVVRDKRVVVVDDSIIRGTTCRSRVRTLKDAGAREVHMRISCPPTRYACFYGIDFPTRTELLAARHSTEEIRTFIEADTLGYLSLDGMLSCLSQPPDHYCTACWTGEYPIEVDAGTDKFVLERHKTCAP